MEQQILLIEDDSALGRGVAVALTEPGRIVALARDLQQARQRWEQQSFDLVVLDLNLPDGNGLDFLRWLRQRSQVPVLILTANDLESDEVAGLTLGADDYVTKPFSLAVLRARVSNLLRHRARRRAEQVPRRRHVQPALVDAERLHELRIPRVYRVDTL